EGRGAVVVQGPDLLLLRGGLQAEVRPRAREVSRGRLEPDGDGSARAMIEPALLRGRDRYERVTTGRVDNTHDDAFTHVVRLEDPERGLEVEIVVTPSPDYAIRAARCLTLRGDVAPSVAAGVTALAGTAMVGGLTGRAARAPRRRPGALPLDARQLPRHRDHLRDRRRRPHRESRARHAAPAVHGHLLGAAAQDRRAARRDGRRGAAPAHPATPRRADG